MTEFRRTEKLMGSTFELVVADEDEEKALRMLDAGIEEIKLLEALLSEFKPDSETSILNQNAGEKEIKVHEEVYYLLERCQHISALTSGAFDITVGPLKKLYNFKNKDFQFPELKEIEDTKKLVGFRKIKLHENGMVFLEEKGMKISFSAIGKGYAADKVKELWEENGIKSGSINASGDLAIIGNKADGSKWKIGIANPDNREQILMYIPLGNLAVATSGDYEQFFMLDNIRFSHNISPFTGLPLTGLKSVTIISPSAELSDALATAVYVMGIEKGIAFVNRLPDTHCVIIDEDNEILFSKYLNLNDD